MIVHILAFFEISTLFLRISISTKYWKENFKHIYIDENIDQEILEICIYINIDIDKDKLKNIDIYIDIDMATPENINININTDILEKINNDITEGILQNIVSLRI